MIAPRSQQRTIYEGIYRTLIPDQKQLLWEQWLLKIDARLDDEALVELVQTALEKRHPQSRTRGRKGTPAEVVLRLLVLKHLQHWSDATLEREVRANLVYRDFTRIGGEPVPDAKTMVRLGQALGPALIQQLHARIVQGRARSGWSRAGRCGWIRRWWRPTSTTRRTAVSSGTAPGS